MQMDGQRLPRPALGPTRTKEIEMEPLSAGIMAGGNMLAGMFGGQDEFRPGKLHSRWADPFQGALFQQQMKGAMSGAGDFGFGQAAKQGNSQLSHMMADRGISPQSGVGMAAQGNMLSQAMGQDVGNRRQYTMGLLNTQPIKQTSAEGWERYGSYGRWGEPSSMNQPSQYSA